MRKQQLVLLLFSLLITCRVWAVKAYPFPVTVKQSDGTKLTIIGRGDEHMHYFLTTDGVLLCHEGNDFFVAQVSDEGRLIPTTVLAHEREERDEEEKQFIARQNKEKFNQYLKEQRQKAEIRRREPIDTKGQDLFPHTGKPKVVVILAQFTDATFIDEDPKSVFEQYLNADEIDNSVGNQTVGNNYGSVKRYFKDMSFGQFEPQFDIYGPVSLPHPTAYYGEGNDNMHLFIPDVCELAEEQGLDFSAYDSDNDGNVDLVYVIYAGYAESYSGNPSTCIWPKSGTVWGKVNGKNLHRYGVNAELIGFPGCWSQAPFERISGIGLFCHEFSHCLGLPDFYPTATNAQNAYNPGMEMWSLMDNGEYAHNGYYPTEYTAWEREAMNWFKIDTLKTSGTYMLRNINEKNGNAYRLINEANPEEYFILENIQPTGWNTYAYGHGMLVSHVEYNANAFTLTGNSVNNIIGRSRMTIVPADNELLNWYQVSNEEKTSTEYYQSHAGDTYPGTQQVNEIPSFTTYTGTMKARIASIDETNGIITFYYDDGTSGIHDLTIRPKERKEIYTLDGLNMGTDKHSLPKGIYIINHRKVAVFQ